MKKKGKTKFVRCKLITDQGIDTLLKFLSGVYALEYLCLNFRKYTFQIYSFLIFYLKVVRISPTAALKNYRGQSSDTESSNISTSISASNTRFYHVKKLTLMNSCPQITNKGLACIRRAIPVRHSPTSVHLDLS